MPLGGGKFWVPKANRMSIGHRWCPLFVCISSLGGKHWPGLGEGADQGSPSSSLRAITMGQ